MGGPKATDWRSLIFATRAPAWSILIRLIVGLVVFFPEGLQKLIFPSILGAGRFAISAFLTPKCWEPSLALSRSFVERLSFSGS